MTRSDTFELELIERLANLSEQLAPSQDAPSQIREQSPGQLDVALQSISDGIMILDAAHKIIYANRAAANIFQFDTSQATLQFSISQLQEKFEIFDEQEQPFPVDRLPDRIAFKDQQRSRAVLYLQSKTTDESFWVVVTSTPVFDQNEQVKFAVITVRDITADKEHEAELRRYHALFETMTRGVVYHDADGHIIAANPAAQRILGLSLAQLQGRTSMDPRWRAIHEDGSDFPGETHPGMISLQTGRSVFDTVMGVFNPAINDYVWININAVPIFKPGQDKPFQVYATFEDITARKQAEIALRESEEHIRSIFRSAPIGIGLVVNRVLKQANKYLCELTGYSEQELINQSARILYPSDEEFECVGREKYAQIANGGTGTVETRWQRKDGTHLDILLSSTALDLNDLSRGVTFTALDITERKQAEQALQQSEARYRTLFEQANDAFFVNTEDDRILDANQRACQLLGYTREELRQLTVPDLQAPEMRGQVGGVIKDELTRSEEGPFEFVDITRDGVRIPVEITTTPIVGDDGKNKLVLSVVRDITERKQAEEALRRYAARLEALRKIERRILAASGPQEIAQAALHHIRQMLPCLRVSIVVENMYDPDVFDVLAVYVNGKTELGTSHSIPKSVMDIEMLRQGKTVVVNDLQLPPDKTTLPKLVRQLYAEGIRSYINVPLIVEQKLIGTLNVGAAQVGAYNSTHLEIAREITDSLAVAIHHAHLYAQARKDAETKTTLLREVNHRVKNNLAAIVGLLYVEKDHADMQSSELYRNIMTDLIKRIEGISVVHQMLSDSEWMPLSLEKLTAKILNSTFQVLSSDQLILVQVDCPAEVYIVPKQANSLALLLNELTTNTVKYALPDRDQVAVWVDIRQLDEGLVCLRYRDDGPGFPPAVLQKRDFSVGLYLLHNIVASDLRGDITLSNNEGAEIIINFRPMV